MDYPAWIAIEEVWVCKFAELFCIIKEAIAIQEIRRKEIKTENVAACLKLKEINPIDSLLGTIEFKDYTPLFRKV